MDSLYIDEDIHLLYVSEQLLSAHSSSVNLSNSNAQDDHVKKSHLINSERLKVNLVALMTLKENEAVFPLTDYYLKAGGEGNEQKMLSRLKEEDIFALKQKVLSAVSLKFKAAESIKAGFYRRGASLPTPTILGSSSRELALIHLKFMHSENKPQGFNADHWHLIQTEWIWNETFERNTFKEALAERKNLALFGEKLAQQHEVEVNTYKYERLLTQNRQALDATELTLKNELTERGLLYGSPAFWVEFYNIELMKKIFFGQLSKFRETRYFNALVHRYLEYKAKECGEHIVRPVAVKLPDIQFEYNDYNAIVRFVSDPLQKRAILLDSDFEPVVNKYLPKLYPMTFLQELSYKVNALLSERLKTDAFAHPQNGLDWLVKADHDMKKWFDLVACDSPLMTQFDQHLKFKVKGEINSVAKTTLTTAKVESLSEVLIKQDLKLATTSVLQSCMFYYAYDSLRRDWCGCIELSLHRDYLEQTGMAKAISSARYRRFSENFKPLLSIGNIEPFGAGKELDEPIYEILKQCDRIVL